jgi:probable rRNA maturation factor
MVVLRKAVAGLSEAALNRFARRAVRAVGLLGQANILVTTNREMKSLNLRFRSRNAPTDVLSFPPGSELPARDVGDIAISAEMAAKNGKRLGHSAAEEVKILTLHGLLHLAGYDHEHDNGRMARREQQLRIQLGLPSGLIERNTVNRPRVQRRGKRVWAAIRTALPSKPKPVRRKR